MSIENRTINFRSPDINDYPELEGYTDSQIYKDFIGVGGLYLATKMIRQMSLKSGDVILDLGCGKGETSIYLAKNFDVTVIAVDFWNSPDELLEKAAKEDISKKIMPLQMDITQGIPFSAKYFDAIFCMNSLFMFGENIEFIKRLLCTLKTGGTLCIGSECFNKEPSFIQQSDIPSVYNFDWQWRVWEECYSKYHSPEWWKSLLSSTNLLDINFCDELEDGQVLFEDFTRNYDSYVSEDVRAVNAVIPQNKFIEQVLYGVKSGLYPTLYVLSGVKK